MLPRVGMREGLMAAATSSEKLLDGLKRRAGGTFTVQQSLAPEQWLKLPEGEDAFHLVTRDGRSYLLDPAMVLTSNSDLVVDLSSDFDCSVVALGAETVSGTYWIAAADAGRLRRLHWNVRSGLTEPFDAGEVFFSERRVPLDDVDGNGLFACLAELGFDPSVVTRPTSGGVRVDWLGTELPPPGPLQREIDAHHERFSRPEKEDWTKHIKAVPRAAGGFDLQYKPPAQRRPLIKRIFGR